MTITEATIGRVRYFPEQLPDSAVPTIAATSEASPIILELKQIAPLLVRLSEVAVDRDDEVEMRFKVDKASFSPLAGSMFDGHANNFSLLARDKLYYNLYNSGVAAQTDYKTFFSLWVIRPTVAHKLRLGIPLTPEEQKLNRDLGIDNIRIAIDRDHVVDYVEFPTWGLGATAAASLAKEISCFIPAVTELRIKLKATTSKSINIRFTVQKVALTNIFRARWGLATREELPGDVYSKVLGGVL